MFVSCIQVFRPGGFNGNSGTSNLLLTLDDVVTKIQWNTQQVGGLQDATFEMTQDFETILDLQAGNWVYFGCLGGTLNSNAVAGATSIVVSDADFDINGVGATTPEFKVGDYIMISDNTNTDLLKVASVTSEGAGEYILGLSAAPGQGTPGLLNSYGGLNARVVRLMYSGKMISRPRWSDLSLKYSIVCMGFSDRYNDVLVNANIVQQDAANSIYGLALAYADTISEVIVSSGNFASANGILCNSTATEGNFLQVVTDILRTENSTTTDSLWSFDVDVVRQACHQELPTVTQSWTFDVSIPNSLGDICGILNITDQDITQLVNLAIVYGGTDEDTGQQLKIIVQDQVSQGIYGFYEASWSNDDLTDQTSAANWGAGQLGVLAYPRTTGTLPLLQTTARFTCRDLALITGWVDSTTDFLANINSIQFTADASTKLVTANINLLQTKPNLSTIMGELSGEVSQKTRWSIPQTALIDSFVVSGFDLTLGS
jgi:hypothetical protein